MAGWRVEAGAESVSAERSSDALGRLYGGADLSNLRREFAELMAEVSSSPFSRDSIALSRIDPALDLAFEDGREGLDLLAALQHVAMPRLESRGGRDAAGLPKGAWWKRPSGGIVARAYDHGREHRYAHAGEVVRLEAQVRFSGAHAPSLAILGADSAALWLRQLWLRRFAPLLGAVVNRLPLADLIGELWSEVAAGRLSMSKARRLAGSHLMSSGGVPEFLDPTSRAALRRDMRHLRSLGLAAAVDTDPSRPTLMHMLLNRGALDDSTWCNAGPASSGRAA